MKRIFSTIGLLLLYVLSLHAQQADMPTIIVFPDDVWMNDHGYMDKFNNDGETEYLGRYSEAFAENREVAKAIDGVQKALADYGFDFEDLQTLLKGMKDERAREMAYAADGDAMEKSAMDELMQQALPDIRIDVDYSVEPFGFRKNISFSVKAVDAYCYNQIALIEGNITDTSDPVDLALRKIVRAKGNEFCEQIKDYFLDLRENGRQITVVFRVADGSGIDFLRDEIGEDEDTYNDFLHKWIRKHAVNRAAKKGRQTRKMCEFKNVRIPFFNDEGEPNEPEQWANGIRKAFRTETGQKVVKGAGNTLGRVTMLVGK